MARTGPHRRRLRCAASGARGALRQLNLLLDTHVALWWANDPAEIAADARGAITDPANDVYLSAASVWEAALEAAAGRLSVPSSLEEAAAAADLTELPVRWRHARRAAELPALHCDPFDRMLVAQALEERLVLVTRDPLVRQYDVPTLPG